jgi:glycosyltransferase involved in cell wall biosynthesis
LKLIIQIPCLNEEATLPRVLAELPREVPGFDQVEWLVVDDGSADRTVDVAWPAGADHVVCLTANKGLAAAFQAGIDAALKLGADVIVNTDADNQYRGADIPKLVEPILAGRAEMVVGDRQVREIKHFSPLKKLLQRLGSWVVRRASGTSVTDTTSGFRAYTREAALGLQVVSNYTYTLESLIQAGTLGVAIEDVPIATNPQLRPSRLLGSTGSYVRRNGLAVVRAYALYQPLRTFSALAALFALGAVVAWSPFLVDWTLHANTEGHIQSLILGAVLALVAVQMLALGVIGDTLAGQRVIAQRTFERVRRLELGAGIEPSHYANPERPRMQGSSASQLNELPTREDEGRIRHSSSARS